MYRCEAAGRALRLATKFQKLLLKNILNQKMKAPRLQNYTRNVKN